MDLSAFEGRKILVVGRPCSGKTTLARKMSEQSDIPLYDLDDIYWSDGWERLSEERFIEQLGQVVRRDKWILSGNYMPTLPFRLRYCTDVVVVDSSWYSATLRYLRRIYRRARGRERHAAYSGWTKEFKWKFLIGKVLLYARTYKEFNALIGQAPVGVGIHFYDARTGAIVRRRAEAVAKPG